MLSLNGNDPRVYLLKTTHGKFWKMIKNSDGKTICRGLHQTRYIKWRIEVNQGQEQRKKKNIELGKKSGKEAKEDLN